MSRAPVLPRETQVGWCNRWWKFAKKRDQGLQVSTTLHRQAERSRLATNSLGRETLGGASCIRTLNEHANVTQPSELGRSRHGLGDRQPLVADDAKLLHFHPGTAPCDGLGGHRRLISPLPIREGSQGGFGLAELRTTGVTGAGGADTGPRKQGNAERCRRQLRDCGPNLDRAERSDVECHQSFRGGATLNDS